MRQFFSWRIWAAFAAVLGLVLLLKLVLPTDAAEAPEAVGAVPDRTVDFVSFVYQVQPGTRFFVRDGLVNGSADVVIDGQRTMHIVEGTPGSLNCPDYLEIGKCVVVADLLGDAVVWFDIVPVVQPGYKVNAPPIVDILDDNTVRLSNGWIVSTVDFVDRRCDDETGSLREFIDRLGPGSTTIIDVASQKVTAVVCAEGDSSSTTVPAASTPTSPSIDGSSSTVPTSGSTSGTTDDSLIPEG